MFTEILYNYRLLMGHCLVFVPLMNLLRKAPTLDQFNRLPFHSNIWSGGHVPQEKILRTAMAQLLVNELPVCHSSFSTSHSKMLMSERAPLNCLCLHQVKNPTLTLSQLHLLL